MKQNPKTKFCIHANLFVNKFFHFYLYCFVHVKQITKKIFNRCKLF